MRWLLVALAACANLPPLTTGVCGNGVLEPGEDCDHAGSDCDRCQLVCASDDQCAPYPGYHCGADDRCHAPGGAFTQTGGQFAVSALGYRVLDFDRDRIGDVIAISPNELTVHFGDERGRLDEFYSTVLPGVAGEPAYGTIGDAAFLALPTRDGIAEFRSDGRVLVPYPFGGDPMQRGNNACVDPLLGAPTVGFTAVDETHIVLVVSNPATHKLHAGMLDLSNGGCLFAAACNLDDAGTTPLHIDHADVSKPGTGIWLLSASAGPHACVVRFTQPAASAIAASTLASSDTWIPNDSPIFARLSSPTCPSLVVRRPALGTYELPPTTDAIGCTLAGAASARLLAVDSDRPVVGRTSIRPAIAPYAPDALVLDDPGVFASQADVYLIDPNNGGALSIYHSIGQVTGVATGDLDGDGIDEAVLQRADGIDVLYRHGTGLANLLPYRLPTAGAPLFATLGDFDGNGRQDIAYVDKVGADYKVMVAFGTPDRPLPATQVASLQLAAALATVNFRDSIDPFGQLTDLMAVDVGTGKPQITTLHGSPQRVMLAYYDPRVTTPGSQFVSVAMGQFEGSPDLDLLGIEANDNSKPGESSGNVWHVAGTPGGGLDPSRQTPLKSPFDSNNACPGPLPCAPHLALLRWPLADGDVVIGVDTNHQLITIDPMDVGADGQHVVTSHALDALALAPALRARITAADLDGDGRRDLVIAFAPFGPGAGIVAVCQVDNGHPTTCTDIVASTPQLAGYTCFDAKPAYASPAGRSDPASDATPDLVALCRAEDQSAVFRLHTDHVHGFVGELVHVDPDASSALEVGDVTGDGVDDLVLRAGGSGLDGVVHIWPQCEARDVVCRAAPP